MKFCTLVLAAIVCLPVVASAEMITLGDKGDQGNIIPFNSSNDYRVQFAYDGASFTGPISISALKFNSDSEDSDEKNWNGDVSIMLATANFDHDSMTSTFANNLASDATEIFNDTNLNITGDEVKFTFSSSFTYDPTSGKDLIVDITAKRAGGSSSWTGETLAGGISVGARTFSSNINSAAASSINDEFALRPTFTFASVPEPTSFTLFGMALAGMARRRRVR